MLLCQEDIKRLEQQGYGKESFAQFDKAGYATLRNREGCCVFYDAEKRKCNVYANRPSGCRLYPIIYDEEKGIIIDDICHAQGVLTEEKKQRKGKKVMELLEKIDAEAEKRRSA